MNEKEQFKRMCQKRFVMVLSGYDQVQMLIHVK